MPSSKVPRTIWLRRWPWPESAKHYPFMKHNNFPRNQFQKQAVAPLPSAVADPNKNAIDFAPSPDEVARKAYFSYVNEGSRPGRDIQHWLEAEAQLLAERNRTRAHGFHNRT